MRAYTHTHANTQTYTRKHTDTYTHTCKPTHTQTYAHVRALHPHKHIHNVLSRLEARVCGTTCRKMSRRLDPSSCLSRYLKRSYVVNLSKYRLFLNFVTVPSTLFDLFVEKNGVKCPTSSHNTPVYTIYGML